METGAPGRVLSRVCGTISVLLIAPPRIPALMILCVLVSSIPLRAQQSMQTQRVSRGSAAGPRVPEQIPAAKQPPAPPPKFFGWIKAQQDGQERFDKFAK